MHTILLVMCFIAFLVAIGPAYIDNFYSKTIMFYLFIESQ